jgi:hypothetical protein
VDLVSEPAANPSGFFARKLKELQEGEVGQDGAKIKMEYPMNDEMKKAIEGMIQSAMMAMGDRVAKLESAIPSEKEEDKPAAMSAQNEAVQLAANAAALAAIKEFSKSFGAPSAPVASAEVSAPAVAAQKFEDVVAAKSVELKGDKSAAIAFSIKNHSDLYVAYRSRVQAGEIIKL